MGWLRKILKGSASNSRKQSNSNEDGNWDESRDLLDEALDSERNETHYATTLSSAEENEAEEDQRSDDRQLGTGDEQYYKACHLVNEDERLAEALPQSLVFNSNPLWEIQSIFPHFPFSFYSMDRQRSNGSCEDDERCSSSIEPNDTEDKSTESEEEETDYQIASIRSFSEDGHADDLYGAASTEDWAQYEELKSKHEDDRPAHFFQQNLTFESSSPFDIAKIFQPFPFSFYPDNGQAFRHPECIHSYASDGLLTDHEVFDSEDYSIDKNIYRDHHLNHHRHHHPCPICYVCGQPIPVDADGRLVFRQHPFWRQKYCRAHERDGTPSCCGCKRLKPGGSTYSILSDNRWLCPECRDSTVMDNHALKPLEREIREFYERLGMKIHQRNIPLLLVNQQEMKKDKARCQKNDHHRPNQTLGLTSWKTLRICTTLEGKDHILVAHSRDLTIRVWKGFPRLFTGQTLAHEMMHAWLTLEGYHDLDLVVEEGLCEILAHMWLDYHMRSMSKRKIALSPGFDFQKRLALFLQHDIESNPDHVYGDGFRKMKRATDIYGLKGTLDFIRMTGSYP